MPWVWRDGVTQMDGSAIRVVEFNGKWMFNATSKQKPELYVLVPYIVAFLNAVRR